MSGSISTSRILVSNDDGIHAPGLRVLEEIARSLSDDVWVVAPEYEQSGAGHSLTLTEPLRLRKVEEKRFAVRGTPTDSVMLAVNHIMGGEKPTLLLSGVNRGANLAEDVTYSGTVAAAIEGTLTGIPSIALSQAVAPMPKRTSWTPARTHARDLIAALVREGWPPEVLINVNFPAGDADAVKGIGVSEQGRRDLGGLVIEERRDPRGLPYYWFGLSRSRGKPGHETDLKLIDEGWISVTPLHLDLTHHATRQRLADGIERRFADG